ncbi:uncharacterized protein PG998_001021 [Apiospora kogelbergensis]|uniref:uncharacterized protein n=1 Tax=Apiospora kogelbergensis TaxID=1337665 RepID=UPI00312FB497
MASTADLGPFARLWGISASRLPSPTASADELAPFLVSILEEALPFLDSAAPRAAATSDATTKAPLWKPKGVKSSPDSAAPVEVSERVVGAGELETVVARALLEDATRKKTQARLGNEVWACRRSAHEDAEKKGTASWAEFVRCFRDEHAAAEDGFTPAVVATCEALSWDCGAVGPVEIAEEGEEEEQEGASKRSGRRWGRFTLKVVEMRHKVGRPVLKDRTFPVLQLTATVMSGSGAEAKEFVVVSIPIPDFGKNEASRLAGEKGSQIAVYASVERIRRLEQGHQGQSGKAGEIEWLMATASDAGGVLPSWVQNMAMPGIIWKDVPLFLRWIDGERRKKDVAKDGPLGRDAAAGTRCKSAGGSAPAATATAASAPKEGPDDTDVTSKIAAAFDSPGRPRLPTRTR